MADFVPETPPLRQWADTLPWGALVAAIDRSFAQRFPLQTTRGRAPVAARVLLALELLKHEVHCSDEQICSRLRTDLAVTYACGIRDIQVDGRQAHFGVSVLFLKCHTLTKRALGVEILTRRFQRSFPKAFSATSGRASLFVLPL